jgi:hypothetical protein
MSVRETPLSPNQLAAQGWSANGGYRRYIHESGWVIEHCGHPTANWPYALYDPAGHMHCQPSGYAWRTVRQAVAYVNQKAGRA